MKIELFDKDLWQEVLFTVTAQKWRSLMTMFGVFWGIFMLVILVGCGFGMKNGILGKLLQLSVNSVFIGARPTNIPYNGLDRDRVWHLQQVDVQAITNYAGDKLKSISCINTDEEKEISNGHKSGIYQVGGIMPEYIDVIPQKVLNGRYFDEVDIKESRKVCMIGQQIAKELFGSDNPCGKQIKLSDMNFKIVGVLKQTNNQISVGLPPTTSVLLPITTEENVFNRKDDYSMLVVTFKDEYPIHDYAEGIKSMVKKNHTINPNDKDAVFTLILSDAVKQFSSMQIGLTLLLWIIGIGTLLAGLIGIANIMFVMVNERTQEIGVRRALGAHPEVIIRQIMMEGLVLTGVAGIAGIVAGVWFLAGLNSLLTGQGDSVSLIENPMIPLLPALTSLFIIVLGGLMAGYFPARRAMKIKAIEALREE